MSLLLDLGYNFKSVPVDLLTIKKTFEFITKPKPVSLVDRNVNLSIYDFRNHKFTISTPTPFLSHRVEFPEKIIGHDFSVMARYINLAISISQ